MVKKNKHRKLDRSLMDTKKNLEEAKAKDGRRLKPKRILSVKTARKRVDQAETNLSRNESSYKRPGSLLNIAAQEKKEAEKSIRKLNRNSRLRRLVKESRSDLQKAEESKENKPRKAAIDKRKRGAKPVAVKITTKGPQKGKVIKASRKVPKMKMRTGGHGVGAAMMAVDVGLDQLDKHLARKRGKKVGKKEGKKAFKAKRK